jgi:hypothetical protein
VTADFALTALPTGTLQVRVADGATGAPVTATVAVLETPLTATGSLVTFALPVGDYTVRARALGHHVVTATASVSVGQVAAVTLTLPPAPSILLVDSGAWYYGSQIAYYRQALDDLALAYDEWTVRHPPDDTPTADLLAPYDVVIWSAPDDAPGYIGAQDAITTYLSAGGRLLLSGQDVGFLDAGMPYYTKYLKARLVEDSSNLWTLEGLPGGPFAGLTMTIAGPGGANNQYYPDVVAPADPDAAAPALAYAGDGFGALAVGTCLDYRALYLSFGFEAITDRETRREVMRRALDWLTAPTSDVGLELRHEAERSPHRHRPARHRRHPRTAGPQHRARRYPRRRRPDGGGGGLAHPPERAVPDRPVLHVRHADRQRHRPGDGDLGRPRRPHPDPPLRPLPVPECDRRPDQQGPGAGPSGGRRPLVRAGPEVPRGNGSRRHPLRPLGDPRGAGERRTGRPADRILALVPRRRLVDGVRLVRAGDGGRGAGAGGVPGERRAPLPDRAGFPLLPRRRAPATLPGRPHLHGGRHPDRRGRCPGESGPTL